MYSLLTTHPLSMVMLARAAKFNWTTAKLLLSTIVLMFSGFRLLTVKFIKAFGSLPTTFRGFSLALNCSILGRGVEKGFPMEQL